MEILNLEKDLLHDCSMEQRKVFAELDVCMKQTEMLCILYVHTSIENAFC